MGKPAFGCALIENEDFLDISSIYGRKSLAPKAQFKPMLNNLICETEFRNAPKVCPERVRPLLSVIVPEIITGNPSILRSSSMLSIANNAALAFRVSKMVSTIRISAPPSSKPFTCSPYALTKSSKLTALKPGSLTSGDIDAVLFVGPIEPATYLGFSGFSFVNSSAASLAILADSKLIS